MRVFGRLGLLRDLACGATLLITPGLTIAASSSSTNFTLTRSVIDSGGGVSSSINYEVLGSIGQISGTSNSTNFSLNVGFISIPDTDGDGVLDNVDNCINDSNPTQLDTDGDSQGDACDTDDDNDGLTDTEEDNLGTSRILADSDGDGLTDAEEVSSGGPTAYDVGVDTDPTNPDTDGDGINDGAEVTAGSDPLDPLDPLNNSGNIAAPVTGVLQLGVLFGLLLLSGWSRIRNS